MENKLQVLLRVSVIVGRDMLIGMIFGLTAAILLAKINPHTENYVTILVPIGIIAGILKGFTKFLILNIFSSLPTKGYRFNYPKYKLLFLWLGLFLGALLYSYGFHVSKWFVSLHKILFENTIIRYSGTNFWIIMVITVLVTGVVSYLYEPPYNNNEFLPSEEE